MRFGVQTTVAQAIALGKARLAPSLPSLPAGQEAGISGTFFGSSYQHQTNLSKYPTMGVSGLNENTAALANPNCKVLGYVPTMLSSGSGVGGISLAEATGTDMLLYTSDHVEIRGAGSFANQRLVNPGNALFQSTFITDVTNYLTTNHLHGSFIDNFVDNADQITPIRVDNGAAADYPYYNKAGSIVIADAAAWQTAMISFASTSLNSLKNAGYYMLPNGAASVDDTGATTKVWVARYAAYVNAVSLEYYFCNPSYPGSAPVPTRSVGSLYYQNWDTWVDCGEYIQGTLGIDIFGEVDVTTPVTDTQSARFTRASFIMAWNPNHIYSAWSWAANTNVSTTADLWVPSVHSIDTGLPTGPRTAVGSCWKRQCQNTLVYVNPTLSTQVADGHTIPAVDAVFV